MVEDDQLSQLSLISTHALQDSQHYSDGEQLNGYDKRENISTIAIGFFFSDEEKLFWISLHIVVQSFTLPTNLAGTICIFTPHNFLSSMAISMFLVTAPIVINMQTRT